MIPHFFLKVNLIVENFAKYKKPHAMKNKGIYFFICGITCSFYSETKNHISSFYLNI